MLKPLDLLFPKQMYGTILAHHDNPHHWKLRLWLFGIINVR